MLRGELYLSCAMGETGSHMVPEEYQEVYMG